MREQIEAEFIDETEFNAPVLVSAKPLTTLVNVDVLIAKYESLANTDINTEVEVLAENFIEIEKGFKEFRKARTSLEKKRKEIGDPAYAFHKKVKEVSDDIQKKINPYEAKLLALKDKVENEEKRKQQEIEDAEGLRLDEIKRFINSLKSAPTECIGKSASVINLAIELMELPHLETMQEFYEDAMTVYNASQDQMKQMLENQSLVENAKAQQAERDAEQAEIKAKEDEIRNAERLEFEKEKAEFAQMKKDAQDVIDLQQEEINRVNADKEAEDLMAKQEKEAIEKTKQDNEDFHIRCDEAVYDIKGYTSAEAIIKAIIDNKIRHIKWVA